MDGQRKTLSDIENDQQGSETLDDTYFYIDSTGDQTLGISQQHQTSGNPPDDSDTESLPPSPSAFRFEYRDPVKQISSSSPIRNTTTTPQYQLLWQPAIRRSLPTIAEYDIDADITDDDETEGRRTPRPNVIKTDVKSVSPLRISSPIPEIIRPITIYNLPTKILRRILGYVFTIGNTITPWFSCGMSLLYIRGFGINDNCVTFNDNIDAAFFRVSKACHEVGINLLYNGNRFRFANRSDCATWWLKKIGDNNLRKIKLMTFVLNTGWHHDRRSTNIDPCPSEMSHEEHWCRALSYIRTRVKLEQLTVTTIWWDDPREEYTSIDDIEELELYRKLTVDTLASFRGIAKVKIEQVGGRYIGSEAPGLELLMQQPETTLPPRPPARKMNLAQLLEYCKKENEIKEERIRQGGLALMRELDEIEEERNRERRSASTEESEGNDDDDNDEE